MINIDCLGGCDELDKSDQSRGDELTRSDRIYVLMWIVVEYNFCIQAFALNGDQLYCHPTYRYYSAKNNIKAQLLTADIEEDIS